MNKKYKKSPCQLFSLVRHVQCVKICFPKWYVSPTVPEILLNICETVIVQLSCITKCDKLTILCQIGIEKIRSEITISTFCKKILSKKGH